MNRGLDATAEEIAEGAARLGAMERERLDRAAEAIWGQVEGGDLRAQEAWLRNRQRYAMLLGLDLKSEQQAESGITVINTQLPENVLRGETINEQPTGELEAGAG